MRLLYLSADPGVPLLGHKGASVHVRELVSALVTEGADVVVASPRVGFEGERLEVPAFLVEIDPVLPKEHAGAESLREAVDRQAAQILELARLHAVGAVYERFSLFSDGGVRAARELGIPHVLEVNAPLRDEALRFRTLPHEEEAEAIERDVFAGTDRVLAVSRTLARLLEDAGLEPAKIEVVGNAVDPSKFRGSRREYGESFTIGFAGSLKPWHGVEALLEGFRLALAELPSLRLEVIGSGPLAELVETARLPAQSFAYRGQLSHRDTIGAMARWHAGAAPFLPLTEFYFSPLKLVEYMAAGVCPVASDLPEARELLGHGQRGLLVEPGNAEALAAALVDLGRNPERAAALGQQGREHVLASLTWRHNARRALAALGAHPATVR